MAVELFYADGVIWLVSLPTGLAAETEWPDMDWVKALAPANGQAEEGRATTGRREEAQAA